MSKKNSTNKKNKFIKPLKIEFPTQITHDVPIGHTYTTSNVRVRKDLRTKIYMLRAKSGMTLQDTFTEIFEYYFKNNPI